MLNNRQKTKMEFPDLKKHPPPSIHIPELSVTVKVEDLDGALEEGADFDVKPNPASLASIIPKVEKQNENVVLETNKTPKTEPSAMTYSDDVFSSSSTVDEDIMVTINVGNLDLSCLNEEIDLGTDVKIAGLGDTLPIPELPRPIDRSKIVAPINIKLSPDKRTRDRLESSGDEDRGVQNKSTVKPKDRDKTIIVYGVNNKAADVNLSKRVNTDPDVLLVETKNKNTVLGEVMLDEESDRELFAEDEVVGEINLMENIDTDIPYYGNRIILGNKNKSKKVPKSILSERVFNTKVVLNDCAEKLKCNKRYCSKCHVLFANSKAFDRHNSVEKVTKPKISEKKTVTNESGSKELDVSECGVCHSVFSNKYKVIAHAKNIHDIEPEEYKKKFYSDKTKSKEDKKEVVKNNEIIDLTNPNYCTHCQKVFPNKETLIKHLHNMLTPETDAPETVYKSKTTNTKISKSDLDKIREEVIREASSKLKKDTKTYESDSESSFSESFTDDDDSYRQSPSLQSISDQSSDDDVPLSKLCQDTSSDDNEDNANEMMIIGEECTKCDEILNTQIERVKHKLEHTNLEARNAKDCVIVVQSLSFKQIKDHIEKIAIENSEKEPLYLKCPICFVYLERGYEDMLYHMDKYHNAVKKSQRKSESYMYACKHCEKMFSTFDRTLKHIRDNHPGNTRVGNIKRVELYLPDDPHVSPVSKSVLFKCTKCSLNYFTAFAAETHLKNCYNRKSYWKCPKCRSKFKCSQQKTHEQQHLISDRFDVYTVKKGVHFHVLSKCPLCGVHFTEEKFQDHYHTCENTSPKAAYCYQCDFLIDSHHINFHKEDHEAINTEDFIIVEYEIPKEVERNSGLPVKKMKVELVDVEDSDSEKDHKKVQMLYCATCKSYLNDLREPQTAHYEKTCKSIPKEMCGKCGLVFAEKSMKHHEKLHKQVFSLKNAMFYDLNFKQINPPDPQLPLCPVCWIYFKDSNDKRDHECSSTLFVKCGWCRKDFSMACYDLHMSFHMYRDYNYKIPLRRTVITRIQKLLLKNKDKIYLYQCVHCDLVISGDKVETHKEKTKCQKDVLKQCSKCQLKFEVEDYQAHLRKHENNEFGPDMIIVPFDRKSVIKFIDSQAINIGSDENFINFKEEFDEQPIDGSSREDKPLADRANTDADEIQANDEGTSHDMDVDEEINGSPKDKIEKRDDISDNSNETDVNLAKDDMLKDKSKSNDQVQNVVNVISDEPSIHKIVENTIKPNPSPIDGDLPKPKIKMATLYKCSCGLHFMSEIAIFEHFSSCMETTQNQKCPKCGLLFTPSVLFDHLLAHHRKGRKFTFQFVEMYSQFHTDKDTLHKCMQCELHFVAESFAKEHQCHKTPTRQQQDLCKYCGLRFDATMMKYHRTRHHSARMFNVDAFEIIPVGKNVITIDDTETAPDTKKSSEIINFEDEKKSKKHGPNKIYKCTKCDIHFLSETGARQHITNHAAVLQNKGYCSQCKLKFAHYSLHVEVHHDMYNYKVEDLKIITEFHKGKKQTKKPFEEEIKNVIYRCPDCDVYFLSVQNLYNHVLLVKHEMSTPAIFCDICKIPYGMLNSQKLYSHIENHHTENSLKFEDFKVRNYPVEEPMMADDRYSNNLYKCSQCDVCFMSRVEMFRHRNICPSSRINIVECDDCHIKLSSSTLLEHKRFHHHQKNFKIEELTVINSDNLELQRKIHRGNQIRKIYKCKSCKLYFCWRSACIKHVKRNKSVNILHKSECVKCKIMFHRCSIKSHQRYHHNEYNFKPKDLIVQEYDHCNLKDNKLTLIRTYPYTDVLEDLADPEYEKKMIRKNKEKSLKMKENGTEKRDDMEVDTQDGSKDGKEIDMNVIGEMEVEENHSEKVVATNVIELYDKDEAMSKCEEN